MLEPHAEHWSHGCGSASIIGTGRVEFAFRRSRRRSRSDARETARKVEAADSGENRASPRAIAPTPLAPRSAEMIVRGAGGELLPPMTRQPPCAQLRRIESLSTSAASLYSLLLNYVALS